MPQALSRKVTLSLPEELIAYVDSKAAQMGTNRSRLVSDLLERSRRHERVNPKVSADPARADTGSRDREISRLEARIDELYGEIRDLVAVSTEQPARRTQIGQKRDQLRALQQREADLMERRAAARLRFDPEEGNRLLERAAKLLQG